MVFDDAADETEPESAAGICAATASRPRKNGSKMRPASAASIPSPRSDTAILTRRRFGAALTATPTQRASPPYLTALLTRLVTARTSAGTSADTAGKSSAILVSTTTPRSSTSGRSCPSASATMVAGATTSRAPVERPASKPANSITCSTISVRRRPSPAMTAPYRFTCSACETTPSARFSAADLITASGVRSSCDTPATNSTCCRARRRARAADTTASAVAAARSSSTPELSARLRRRVRATAASSEPRRCCTASVQAPAPRSLERMAARCSRGRSRRGPSPPSGRAAPSLRRTSDRRVSMTKRPNSLARSENIGAVASGDLTTSSTAASSSR